MQNKMSCEEEMDSKSVEKSSHQVLAFNPKLNLELERSD